MLLGIDKMLTFVVGNPHMYFMLRIAIQSSGRIKTDSLALLDKVGVKINKIEDASLLVRSTDFPAEVFFMDKFNVPQCVVDGFADIGICSEFMLLQHEISAKHIVRRLGFNRTTLSLLVPEDSKYDGIRWFFNRTIATPYPELLGNFFRNNGIKVNIRPMNEHVYKAVSAGIADAIFDKVYSGTSLVSEHLREAEKIMQSEAVIVASPDITPSKRLILEELLARIDSVLAAKNKKYVSMRVPSNQVARITELIPSMSPRHIFPTQDKKVLNIRILMDETRLWDIVEKLTMLGVTEIIALPVDNLIA